MFRLLVVVGLGVGLTGPVLSSTAVAAPGGGARTSDVGTYANPLAPRVPGDGTVDSCADPSVIRGQQAGDGYWYMYCTTDPLNDADKTGGHFNFHKIPTMRSTDLVNWEYVGDALSSLPSWAEAGAGIWAPDIVYSTTFDKYYLTFTVTNTNAAVGGIDGCGGDSGIGVAVSSSPTGPWVISDTPVVAPRSNGGECNFFWTFDPDVLGDRIADSSHIYYGSYYGGISGRTVALTATGMTSDPGSAAQVTIPNRYEGANVVQRGSYYYLFVSATDCCRGPLTGYSVFAGRSSSPLGPFVDREGQSLLAGRVGGTPVLSMNGNRWTGTGHNTVFQDFAGQWWTIYHAVDRDDPYFAGATGFTKRPALLDAIDWVDDWPTVNGGRWASDTSQPAPAAQPGQRTRHQVLLVRPLLPGDTIPAASTDFDGSSLDPAWSWVRQPSAERFGVAGGTFRFDTQRADLFVNSNNASVLTRPAPVDDYMVETKVALNLPPEGCCFNYVQAGLVIYGDDDNFVKLAHVSIWETRQTEFAKEVGPVPGGYPRYGNTVVGPPADSTYLRVVVERLTGNASRAASGDTERYTAYTSQDGVHWVRGGAWTHKLGSSARIGLISMGGSGFTANFDYVRTSTVRRG